MLKDEIQRLADESRESLNSPKEFRSPIEAFGYLTLELSTIEKSVDNVRGQLDKMWEGLQHEWVSSTQLNKMKTYLMVTIINSVEMYVEVLKAMESEEKYE